MNKAIGLLYFDKLNLHATELLMQLLGISPAEALFGYLPSFNDRLEVEAQERGAPAVRERVEKLHKLRSRLESHWRQVTESYQKSYNARHQPLCLKKGDLVGLSTKNLRFQGDKRKLVPKFVRLFRVLEAVGSQAFRIALPAKYECLYPVFPVSLLEPWKMRDTLESQHFLQMPGFRRRQ